MTDGERGALEVAMLVGLVALLFDTYWLTAGCLVFIAFFGLQFVFP